MQIYAPGTTTVDVEWAVGSISYGGGTCDGGVWDYAHEVGKHGWYSVTRPAPDMAERGTLQDLEVPRSAVSSSANAAKSCCFGVC